MSLRDDLSEEDVWLFKSRNGAILSNDSWSSVLRSAKGISLYRNKKKRLEPELVNFELI